MGPNNLRQLVSFKFQHLLIIVLSCHRIATFGSAQDCGKQANGAVCSGSLCCSQYGYCGSSTDYCGTGCQSNCPSASTGKCGKQNGGIPCIPGLCCSQYGYCGLTAAYCGAGCQQGCPVTPTHPPTIPAKNLKRMSYFPYWGKYIAAPHTYEPENINAALYTHLFYFAAGINTTSFAVIPLDPDADIGPPGQPKKGQYYRFNTVTRVKNPKIKTLITIGGGDAALAAAFAKMAATSQGRAKFVASAIAYARKWGFDGIDLDWESPDQGQSKAHFALLLTKLRAEVNAEAIKLKKAPLLLSAAVSVYGPEIGLAFDVPTLNKTLDWVGVMGYDLHGEWESQTGLHTELSNPNNPAASIEGGISTWLASGMAPGKMTLGLAAYGHQWTLSSASNHGVGAPTAGPGIAGKYTGSKTILAYFEIKDFVASGAKVVYDKVAAAVYAYKGKQWVGYDNKQTIAIKAKWARSMGLAGVFFWSIEQDSADELAIAANSALAT